MGSTPGWSYGYVPTAGEWNLWWSNKQDNLGFTPLNVAGGTMLGLLNVPASTSAGAEINLAPGSAPSVPNVGDLWTTTAGLFVQSTLGTVGPLGYANRIDVVKRGVSFAAGGVDILLSISLPAGIPSYSFSNVRLANATAPLTTGSIGLYTGSAAGGTAIVSSTALNITSIAGNTVGNLQTFAINSSTTQTYNFTTVYLHITGGTGSASAADLIVEIFLN
jgi:hypothetical protein